MTDAEELALWREFGRRYLEIKAAPLGTPSLDVLMDLSCLSDWAEERGLFRESANG